MKRFGSTSGENYHLRVKREYELEYEQPSGASEGLRPGEGDVTRVSGLESGTDVRAGLAALYAPVATDIRRAEEIFDEEIDGDLPFINELCDTVRSYRGKMLRPALLLLSARACGKLTSAHHTLAAVVEMVHMATLVHDDVLDEADERRRRPTVNNIAGNEAAVLLGDYLISHAFHLCSSLDSQFASRRIGATTNTVCEGELLQNHYRGVLDLTEQQYTTIVERKTAALTATSCELGAFFADSSTEVVAALHHYGRSVGIAFQIVDDILDIAGDQSIVGKTLGRDAALGKVTLPVLHCLANADAETAATLRTILEGQQALNGNADQFRSCLDRTGSIEAAVQQAEAYVSSAISSLDCLPDSDARQSLRTMASFITERRF
ncbi:MAG: polyprenyl synthetase family protein [Phycisphaerae bacterium]